MKMKILILAIVLCVVDGQTRGYKYGRQSYNARYNGYARQDAEPQTDDTVVNGEQMMLFIIKTLKNLQSLFESYQWDDLYQRPDTTLQLPNKFEERRAQGRGQTGRNQFYRTAQRPANLPGGSPPGRQAYLPPRGRSRFRRSVDITSLEHYSNPLSATPVRTTTTQPPTPGITTTTRIPALQEEPVL